MTSRQMATAAIAATAIGMFLPERTLAGATDFDIYHFEALIDSDNNADTGCDAQGDDDNFTGPIKGIEYIVHATVHRFPPAAAVDEVDTAICENGMLIEDR